MKIKLKTVKTYNSACCIMLDIPAVYFLSSKLATELLNKWYLIQNNIQSDFLTMTVIKHSFKKILIRTNNYSFNE